MCANVARIRHQRNPGTIYGHLATQFSSDIAEEYFRPNGQGQVIHRVGLTLSEIVERNAQRAIAICRVYPPSGVLI